MAGSKSNLDVYLRLHGQRKFAKEVEASGAELEAMGLKGARSMAAFAKSADKLKKFGKSWTHNVSLPIAGLAVVAGGMAVSFKRQMGLISTDAGGTAKEVAGLEKSVLNLSRESQFGPQKLAESLFHVESSGYRAHKAMKVLNASQKLATTGNSELESTTYALVSATKALYGESLKNVNRTAAELNGIVAHGDMRLEELTAAMATGVIPKAKSVGLNLRDVGAAMDVMTARGIPAQRAAYALGFTMQKLIPSGEKAEEAFASIGLGQETLINASTHGKNGYVTGLEVLEKHLDRLPTKAKQTKVIEEMFGGGRMTSGLLTDLQNLGEMKKIYGELGDEVKTYALHNKEAAEQPQVKLEKAWSGIQASLIEIGGELLPEVVPAIETIAHVGQTAADDFQKIPGPVKAIGVAALFAVGPVSSMLGYFAGGVGRTLIMLAKLGRMTQNLGIFAQAMKAGQGLSGSSSIAFNGFGKSAALQTAKGFAYSLAPAVAAYGIGNLVTSATSHDWQDAGFEAGGSLVGGIAGFLVGGPVGAMLGVGLGSLGGELLSGLFSSGPKVSVMHQEMEHLAESTKGYREAVKSLPGVSKEATRAARGHSKAVGLEHRAERALSRTLAKFGPETEPATKAQLRLDKAQRAVVRSAKAEREAHRKVGNALKVYRMQTVEQVASIKQLLPGMAKRVRILNQQLNREPHNLKLAEETLGVERKQAKSKRELTEIYAQSESQAGKPWTKRLESMTSMQAKFGQNGKVLTTRLNEQVDAFKSLKEEGAVVPGLYRKIAEEIRGTSRELGKFNAETEGIGVPRLPSLGAEGKHHPGDPSQKPGHHKASPNSLRLPAPRRLSLDTAGIASGLTVHVHVENENNLNVDGKSMAENVTRYSKRSALAN